MIDLSVSCVLEGMSFLVKARAGNCFTIGHKQFSLASKGNYREPLL